MCGGAILADLIPGNRGRFCFLRRHLALRLRFQFSSSTPSPSSLKIKELAPFQVMTSMYYKKPPQRRNRGRTCTWEYGSVRGANGLLKLEIPEKASGFGLVPSTLPKKLLELTTLKPARSEARKPRSIPPTSKTNIITVTVLFLHNSSNRISSFSHGIFACKCLND